MRSTILGQHPYTGALTVKNIQEIMISRSSLLHNLLQENSAGKEIYYEADSISVNEHVETAKHTPLGGK